MSSMDAPPKSMFNFSGALESEPGAATVHTDSRESESTSELASNENAPQIPDATTVSLRSIEIIDGIELMERCPPPWLVESIMRENDLAMLYAPPGAGKTFFAIGLSIAIAAGRPFAGLKVSGPASVLFLAGEGLGGLPNRVRAAMSGWENATEPAILKRFMVTGDAPQLLEPANVDALIKKILSRSEEYRPRLIVIDTMARHFGGGDENSSRDMGIFVAACDRLRREIGCAVLIIHHSRRADSQERGSGAARAACEVVMVIRSAPTPKGVSDSGRRIRLVHEKSKEGELAPAMTFDLEVVDLGKDGDGQPRTSLRLRRTEEQAPQPGGLDKHALAILTAMRNKSPSDAVHGGELRKSMQGVPGSTYTRRLSALVKDGYLVRKGGGTHVLYFRGPHFEDVQ